MRSASGFASGVCGTDGHFVDGTATFKRFPAVIGHEGAGIIDAVGSGATVLSEGDHVLFNHSAPCGNCRACQRGSGTNCSGPSYADWASNRTGTRVRLGDGEVFPLEAAPSRSSRRSARSNTCASIRVPTGLGAVFNTARVGAGDAVCVVGAGGVGLSIVQGARIAGAEVIIAMDAVPGKRKLAHVDLHLEGKLLLDDVVSRFVPLQDVVSAIDALGGPDVGRTVVTFP